MAYDDDLAYRIRELLSGESGVAEKSMFGGLAFTWPLRRAGTAD